MKKLIFMSVISLLLGLTVKAQQNNIVVSIAKKATSCNSTDLGYQVYYGASSSSELERKAVTELKRNNPDWQSVESKDNIDWGSYMGNYLVIISTVTTDSKGCQRVTYGVGFGKESSSALKDALSHVKGRNWTWLESKHGYRIEVEKRY
ncbi:MAG: hypothetical protein CMP76_00010 [Flavobacterium sp.]|uniref:hypothetical protein n=1 Tax=unclassified Flavobacterium TaxID=196869 RepID=UPI000C42A1D1|nr:MULTISPECIES: hypothetical protein [unclassified Flavobacterium]MBF01661.1 hypothetical protein [Flavobacterium sp.]MCO6162663.1 hypothetical protein [Flavobacterium sp. NRK F7]